jgi:hypothetical protein
MFATFYISASNDDHIVLEQTGSPAAPADFSRFYNNYLETSKEIHMSYNKAWWAANVALLYPAFKAEWKRLSKFALGVAFGDVMERSVLERTMSLGLNRIMMRGGGVHYTAYRAQGVSVR